MDYTETERSLACFEKQLGDLGKDLIALGTVLRDAPDQVGVGSALSIPDDRWSVAIPASRHEISPDTFNLDRLYALLQGLAETTKERDRLRGQLQRMGLQNLAYQRESGVG